MLRDYYLALKPERTYANVMTTLAGFLFACRWHVNWALLAYTLVGTTLIVMSACAVNNVTDRELDARMPRTRKRATATGLVPARRLLAVAVLFGVVGFGLLATRVNLLTASLGVLGYVDYVLLYAWSKRTTPYSTMIGTISGAVPLVAGYAAATGQLDATALLLGLIMLAWQMPHFYAIGIFRLKDYQAGGLPIWPVVKGVRSTQLWIMAYTALYVLAVLGLSWFGHVGWVFAVVIGSLGLYWLFKGFKGFAALQPEKWARGMFGFSLITLLALSAMLTLAPLLTSS
jgi:protoheme IX farnesyltransferase